MNKPVYPIGSAHRKHDLYKELPRIDCGMEDGSAAKGFLNSLWFYVVTGIALGAYIFWRLYARGIF